MKSNFYLRLKSILLPLFAWLLLAMSLPGAAQTVATDKADYLPGEHVIISGTGWLPGESVNLLIEHLVFTSHPDQSLSTTTDASGNLTPADYTIDDWDLGETFRLTATGQTSGSVATTTFTDAGGSYSLKWYAADPAVNKAPYLPTYPKLSPGALPCNVSGGRASGPLANSVAYASPATTSNLDAVTSLAPKDMALCQVVPFFMEISVSGSTTPENGVITFSTDWLAKTTSGDNFGFDPSYGLYCAFVDVADPGTIDPGGNAKVDSYSSTTLDIGGSNERISGTVTVSGLDNGDRIIVELWVVLKCTIPAGSTGNVQTSLQVAHTGPSITSGEVINTGNQTVPLLRVQEFFSAEADVQVTKSSSPVCLGENITYTMVVTNNSTTTVANGVVATDVLGSGQTFVSATGSAYTQTGQTVTFQVGALSPLESKTLTIVVTPTASGTVANTVTVTAITRDPVTTNNSATVNTNVTQVAVTVDDQAVCYGEDVSFTADVSGADEADYNFVWKVGNATQASTSSTLTLLDVTTGATISVTATPKTGATTCSGYDEASLTVNPAIIASAVPTQPLCYGELGSINLTVSGGTPFDAPAAPYTFAWLKGGDAFATTEDLANLEPGTYAVTVTDKKGCTATASAVINAAPAELTADAVPTQLLCYGDLGSINLTVGGGTGTKTFAWTATNGGVIPEDMEDEEDLTNLVAGTYSVVVTDANGCTAEASAVINMAPDQLTADAVPTQLLCYGDLGSINLTVGGGTGTKTFAWTATNGGVIPEDMEDEEDLTNLVAGTYSVVVTDANGCTAEASAVINMAPDQLTADAVPTQLLCYGDLGSINLTVGGGTGTKTFAWTATNGGVIPEDMEDEEDLTNLVAGTYSVVVTDANGCTAEASAVINMAPDQLLLTATPTQPLCFGDLGSVLLEATGGTAPYTFGGDAVTDLEAGDYTYTVTDENGCEASASVTIVPTTQITVSITADVDCELGKSGIPSGTITVTGSGYETLQLWSAGANKAIGGGDDQMVKSATTSASPYDFEGVYSGSYYVIALAPNTAGAADACDAISNVDLVDECYWFNIVKKTQGVVDPSKEWQFKIYLGSDGFGKTSVGSSSSLNDADGILNFGNVNLDPDKTYTICEENMAAGWSAIWITDINGTSTVLMTYNPQGDETPPQDLGNRCFDIGAGTDYPLYANDIFTINVDNTYPGGTARTPGYWKNWNTCTGGGQAANAEKNGGWQAGYWLLDNVLNSPGVTLGAYTVTTCKIGVSILDQRDISSGKKSASDPIYTLAMHLMAFKCNQAAGAYGCPYAIDAAAKADAVLISVGYNAQGSYLKKISKATSSYALALAKILDEYNNNRLSSTNCAKTAPVLAQQKSGDLAAIDLPTTVEPTFKAYPNPFTDKLNIEFSSAFDTQAKLEIYSVTGAKLETLFDGPVNGGELYTVEYLPKLVSSQIVLYHLTMNDKTQVGKLIYNERK